jgi:hypothetical protein
MKNFILVCLIGMLFAACKHRTGSGNMVTRVEEVAFFNKLKASGSFYIEVVPGATVQSVQVTADDNIMEDVLITVEDEELQIRMLSGVSYKNVHTKVVINTASLQKISASASAKVQVKNTLKWEGKIQLESSSAASIFANVDAPIIDAEASSGSILELSGRTQSYKVQCSSGSTITSDALLSENTDVQASSGGSVSVHASVSLKAAASSGGDIDYKGGGSVNSKESSGGSVSKVD